MSARTAKTIDSQHRLPGGQQHGSLRFSCRGSVLIAEGKHRESRVRGKVDRYSYEAKGRSDCHVTFIGSPEGNVEGEKHQAHKSIVNKVKEVEIGESKEPVVLK